MDPLNRKLQQVLKAARAERGWSLTVAAEKTGVSKAMLGQIERGDSSPTIATLWKLASGFEMSFSAFLPSEGTATLADSETMSVAPLFAFDTALGCEMLAVTLAPGVRHRAAAHVAGVVEYVVPLNGSMEVLLDGEWVSVDAAHGLRFAADSEHGYANPGPLPVTFHNVIFYPQEA